MPHVTFIHGIANKVEASALERSWTDQLRDGDGLDLVGEGVTVSQCYWADVLYAAPVPPAAAAEAAASGVHYAAEPDIAPGWFADLPPEQKRHVENLAAELGATEELIGIENHISPADDSPLPEEFDRSAGGGFERIPLPGPVKRRLMRSMLRDVHHYLWDVEFSPRPGSTFRVRQEVRRRTVEALDRAAGTSRPHVLVGHSLGSVIAYDVLANDDRAPMVDGLLTFGCPLGLDEVQDRLKPGWSRWDGYPSRSLKPGSWVNVYDRLDPVCGGDPVIANDFRSRGRSSVTDVNEPNWGTWRHAVEKYLHGPKLRASLGQLLEIT